MTTEILSKTEAYDRFMASKPEGDLDLVQQVADNLSQYGLKDQLNAHYFNHRFVQEAQGKRSDIQRHLLNRYWNLQLAMAPGSAEIRPYLIQTSTVENWFDLFQRHVAPFIVNHQLPRPITL